MLKIPTLFWKDCPVCGRRLHLSVELLGLHVTCQHCGRTFLAASGTGAGDRSSAGPATSL